MSVTPLKTCAWASLACAFLVPLAARAQDTAQPACPTRADLMAHGVQMTRSSPHMAIAYRYEDGTLVSYRADDPALSRPPQRETYANPLIVTRQEGGGASFELRYAETPGIEKLLGAKGWTGSVALVIDDEVKATGDASYKVIGEGKLSIGACTYSVTQVSEDIQMGKLTSHILKEYAPELGLVIRTTKIDPETGKPIGQVSFDEIVARAPKQKQEGQ
ncbi:hypothetical protein BMI90_09900 [Thioclava sp. L04-15]|uniref:hypothetical protein n=1 Tax=Thioclava sp. L04-15 TaxID=1915318 RepID=UPI000997D935|nr:hypothetical protein [Thioclava sp. L04-15]OOY28176.1 hypothetical protein BMI90_09900 [Thioclava sp. L04-15]TNE90612.1 MAG: hypothetical protein EP337_07615 [Paracoccaceae bacterium]